MLSATPVFCAALFDVVFLIGYTLGIPNVVHLPLNITSVEVFPHRAIIHWTGPDLKHVLNCQISYQLHNSSHEYSISSYIPADQSFGLNDLLPDSTYSIQATCNTTYNIDRDGYTIIYESVLWNFTTAHESSHSSHGLPHLPHLDPHQYIYSTAPHSPEQPHGPQEAGGGASDAGGGGAHGKPTQIFGRPLRLSASAVDIGLGIALAILGGAVLITAAVYGVREYRRRVRVRRFLQYRQHENEQFSDEEEDDEEEHHDARIVL